MTIWLVRHGATDWSDAGRFNGRTDVSLNTAGRAQARSLNERLRGQGFDGIWSSPATRAVVTARLAAGEPVTDERLHELDFGALEGKTWAECSPGLQERLIGFEGFSAPGGESVTDLGTRVHDFFAELAPGSHLVFTHGGVIRLLLKERGPDRRVAPGEIVLLATGRPEPIIFEV